MSSDKLYYAVEDEYGQSGWRGAETAIAWLNDPENYAEATEIMEPLLLAWTEEILDRLREKLGM